MTAKNRVLAIVSNKGGVGKTTVSNVLAEAFATVLKKRVLLIDADPQCNTTSERLDIHREFLDERYLPLAPDGLRYHIGMLFRDEDIDLYHTANPNIDLLPCIPENIEYERGDAVSINNFVNFFADDYSDSYDLIIIDTPPAKGVMTTAVIRSSSHILIPCIAEKRSVEGVHSMIQKIANEQSYQEEPCEIVGILPNMFDARVRLHKDMLAMLNDSELGEIPELVIPKLVKSQDKLSSFVIKARAQLKSMELKGATPSSPFQMPPSSDIYKEWLALAKYVESKIWA